MSWKKIICAALFSGILATSAMAAPTASVSGVVNGGNIDWTVSFTPDQSLFTNNGSQGNGGSLAVEFMFEVADTTLNAGTVTPNAANFMDTVNSVVITNPGFDLYANANVVGTQTHASVASQLGGTGNFDAIFAPLGSDYFTVGTPQEALTFTTTGTTGSVTFGGKIAQAGVLTTIATDTVAVAGVAVLGDTEPDGDIDLQDLFNVQNNFGLTSPPAVGDTDGDNDIDLQDLFNVQNNFGLTPSGSGAGSLTQSQVPEPSSVILLGCLASAGAVAIRRRIR